MLCAFKPTSKIKVLLQKPMLLLFQMWTAPLPAPAEVHAILSSNNACTVSFGRKSNWLATRSWAVPGAMWKVLHIKSKTGKSRLFDSFVKCEKKSYFSGTVLWILSWARGKLCLWKWKKGHTNDLSTGNLTGDPMNSETENFHQNFQVFCATSEELLWVLRAPSPTLCFITCHRRPRKPTSRGPPKMLPTRVTDHD